MNIILTTLLVLKPSVSAQDICESLIALNPTQTEYISSVMEGNPGVFNYWSYASPNNEMLMADGVTYTANNGGFFAYHPHQNGIARVTWDISPYQFTQFKAVLGRSLSSTCTSVIQFSVNLDGVRAVQYGALNEASDYDSVDIDIPSGTTRLSVEVSSVGEYHCDHATIANPQLCNNDPCLESGVNCDDQNACTTDTCDSSSGVAECINTESVICGDSGDLCTDGSCDPSDGTCQYTAKCADNLVCEASSGECQRDCDAFQIDEFLNDCSTRYGINVGDIADLDTEISGIDARVVTAEGNITNIINVEIVGIESTLGQVQSDILTNAGEIDGIDATLVNITTSLSDLDISLNGRIGAIESDLNDDIDALNDRLNLYTAKSGNIGNVISDSVSHKNPVYEWVSKDTVIILLLIMNMTTIIGAMVCVSRNKARGKYAIYKNVKVYDENQRLQN